MASLQANGKGCRLRGIIQNFLHKYSQCLMILVAKGVQSQPKAKAKAKAKDSMQANRSNASILETLGQCFNGGLG